MGELEVCTEDAFSKVKEFLNELTYSNHEESHRSNLEILVEQEQSIKASEINARKRRPPTTFSPETFQERKKKRETLTASSIRKAPKASLKMAALNQRTKKAGKEIILVDEDVPATVKSTSKIVKNTRARAQSKKEDLGASMHPQPGAINEQLLNALNLTLDALKDIKNELKDIKESRETVPQARSQNLQPSKPNYSAFWSQPPQLMHTLPQIEPTQHNGHETSVPQWPALLPNASPQGQDSEVLRNMRLMMMGIQHMTFMNNFFNR